MSAEAENKIMWEAMGKLMKMKGLTPLASRLIITTQQQIMDMRKNGDLAQPLYKENEKLPITVDTLVKIKGIKTICKVTKVNELEADGQVFKTFDVKEWFDEENNKTANEMEWHNIPRNMLTPVTSMKEML